MKIDYNLISAFPEDLFPPPSYMKEEYNDLVSRGLQRASRKSAILCGICRDVDPIIELNLIRLTRIACFFEDYRIIIFENDSKDTTPKILSEYSKSNNKIKVLSESMDDSGYRSLIDSGEDSDHFHRATAISNCRNKYIEHINSMDSVDDFDYIIVFDLDLRGGWSYEGIAHSLDMIEEIDDEVGCISANGKLSDYHNTRDLEEIPNDGHLFFDSWAFRLVGEEQPLEVQRFNRINLPRGADPVEVNSNFSGMAIYKRDAILPYRYGAKRWSDGVVNCDHPFLHKQMREDGWKIIMNPSMISSYSHHKYSRIIEQMRNS